MKNKILYIIFILFCTLCVAERPENINPNELRFREIVATRTSMMPIIDGIIDDEVWKTAMTEYDFIQFRPYNLAAPSERTEVRVIYDNEYMYILAISGDVLTVQRGYSLTTPATTDTGSIAAHSVGANIINWKRMAIFIPTETGHSIRIKHPKLNLDINYGKL